MKIWIDDIRVPPDDTWQWYRTSEQIIKKLESDLKSKLIWNIEVISFDHDLGDDDTSMPVARWLEEKYYHGEIKHHIDWHIHSANPVGQKNLYDTLSKCDEYWIRNKSKT